MCYARKRGYNGLQICDGRFRKPKLSVKTLILQEQNQLQVKPKARHIAKRLSCVSFYCSSIIDCPFDLSPEVHSQLS